MDATENECKPETAGDATENGGKTKMAAASGERAKTKKPAMNPVAALALCALLWSFGGLVIKLIKWDALAIAGVRSLLGMITVTIAFRRPPKLFVRRDENSLQDQNAGGNQNCVQGQKTRPKKIDWRATTNLLLGGFFYAATMLLFVPATKMTTAANAILLQYTNPIYIIIFGPLLAGEKSDWIDIAAVAGILAGMVLLLWGDLGGGQMAGNILALLSGVTYGGTTIFLRRAKNTRPSDSLNLSCLLSFLFAIPFIVKAGLPQSAMSYPALLCLGVFQIGMPAVLLSIGIEKVPALSSVIITMIEPMMNPVWVALFAGEVPSASSVFGGLVILACIVAHVALKRAAAVRKMRR
ncbi:MAG: DMT family transporter [Treponema sp.]|nr:DMT family transporter [Treponema sp.]MEE3434121.1 DMT family transporter [Treponema sp.]